MKNIDFYTTRKFTACVFRGFFFLIFFSLLACQLPKPSLETWHDQVRELRYHPEGNDFVITNGTHRFNRALYGSNSGFRVEAGDLPEFALYMPRMGGTLRLGLMNMETSKWLIDANSIEARYRAGTMIYKISDPLLENGTLYLQVLALPAADGMILKVEAESIPTETKLFWIFGGATGKRFSRDGDLGADPESSFYLKPEYCVDNEFYSKENTFTLYYGSGRSLSDNEVYENNYIPSSEEKEATRLKDKKRILGIVPLNSEMHLANASKQENPIDLIASEKSETPAIVGKISLQEKKTEFFVFIDPDSKNISSNVNTSELFKQAEKARSTIANRIKIETPDEYINAVGASLATAADAIWDGQSFMHGAIAWRMPLNGWRGAYAADWLGWHDRAKTHFRGYFDAQYTEPKSGSSIPDTATHLARQKEEVGTALFTDGYISRNPGKLNKPHHYDMNLVFIAQLLSHFKWTGDLDFLRESWPVLERHLAWEKRNFDANDDGLYDAYCCIWASDALQYSGGGVTHSSAYNYRANKMAAELAPLVGKDPIPYLKEAEKIRNAVNENLWLSSKGWFAEYKDLLGEQLVHPNAALWTAYHAIDEGMADPFQAWQTMQYVDKNIPHIPIDAEGLPTGKFHTLSTTNWMPYTWSINNVALAEVLHTALAYWQSGRTDEAFNLTKSSFLDYMFMATSPGNFGQLSFYDALRGELYRDFADPVGMTSRALVEGLFGVYPDLLHETLRLNPGWPAEWEHAKLETPDIKLQFKRKSNIDLYIIESLFQKELSLQLVLKAKSDKIQSVKINGEPITWNLDSTAIGTPKLKLESGPGTNFEIEIIWAGKNIEKPTVQPFYALGEKLVVNSKNLEIRQVYDPQQILISTKPDGKNLTSVLQGELGWRTIFLLVKQGETTWWQPLSFELRKPIELISENNQSAKEIKFSIRNNSELSFSGKIKIGNFYQDISIPAKSCSSEIVVSSENLISGTNMVQIESEEGIISEKVMNWNIETNTGAVFETVDLKGKFNDRITNIFREQYFSPRCPYPTLSIPIQGIGDWCSYKETEEIDDSGLRRIAGNSNNITSPQGIPFETPGEEISNISFTSKWDNYPDSVQIPLSGKASHVYLLMAGSVHHMQIHMVNGIVSVEYADGTKDKLQLISPDNWWPIEQDYYEDGYAFQVSEPQPPRLYLKSGEWHLDSYPILAKNKTIKIEGGAASLLDLPLNPEKELKSLNLETRTNDLVIGLMAATLKR